MSIAAGVGTFAVVVFALASVLSTPGPSSSGKGIVTLKAGEQPQTVVEEVYVYYETAGILINIDEETGWAVIDAQEI